MITSSHPNAELHRCLAVHVFEGMVCPLVPLFKRPFRWERLYLFGIPLEIKWMNPFINMELFYVRKKSIHQSGVRGQWSGVGGQGSK